MLKKNTPKRFFYFLYQVLYILRNAFCQESFLCCPTVPLNVGEAFNWWYSLKVMYIQFVFCCYPSRTVAQFSFSIQVSIHFTSAFSWRVLIFPRRVWHVGCASQFTGCWTFSFPSCHRHCQNTKLVIKREFSSGSVQLSSLTLFFWLINVLGMVSGPPCCSRNQLAVSSMC